ncbi:hypothetical protein FACS189437_04740 [Bacteroidia bacterium]|nr:hypothetical protein FACS189437_04740 [Bacteroidia bacterium]
MHKIFIIISVCGLAYFAIKTIVVILETLKEEINDPNTYALPLLGICYALVSIYFIFSFVIKSNEIVKCVLNNIDTGDINWLKSLISFSSYTVITAFVWNFSKAFFTINSLDFGELNAQKINHNADKKLVIPELLIRIIIALLFIYIEKSLYYEFAHSSKINHESITEISFWIIFLYVGLISWNLWFQTHFHLTNTLSVDSPCNSDNSFLLLLLQFMMGLLLGIFILCFGIGNLFPSPLWNGILGTILYSLPAILLCYFIIWIEVINHKPVLTKVITIIKK